MTEKKPVRREGGEKKRKSPREMPVDGRRKASNHQDENRKKKKKPASEERLQVEGKRKKPSGDRRPPSRQSQEVGVVRKKKVVQERVPSSKSASQQRKRRKPLPKPPSKGKKIFGFVWNLIFYAFVAILLIGVVVFNFSSDSQKTLFGYRFMTVLTNSMAPNDKYTEYKNGFNSGALVFIKQVDPQSLKSGDIITFNPVVTDTSTYLTHRVIDVMTELDGEEGLFFQTKGDANSGQDIPINASQVVGKVFFSIEHVGTIMKFFRENLVIVGIFSGAIFAFCLVFKYYLGMDDKRVSAPRKKRVA